MGRANVRLGDDFQQRDAGTVIVHQAVTPDVKELTGVLLQVGAGDADAATLAVHFDLKPAVVAKGQLVLRDLITLWQIGVTVVLPGKDRVFGNLTIQSQSGHDGKFYRLAVDDRQRARHPHADRANVRVGRLAKDAGIARAEHLGLGLKLHVDFHADDGFVLHGVLLFHQR